MIKMKKKFNLYIVICIILFVVGIFLGNKLTKPEEIHTTTTEYICDTVIKEIKIPLIIQGEIIYQYIPSEVDTNQILKDFFAKYSYKRVWEDSTLYVELLDTVSQNKFGVSRFNYKILKPQTIITNNTTTYVNKGSGIYAGIGISFNSSINLSLDYVTKKNFIYEVGYTPKENAFNVGIKYKIFNLK